MKKVQRGQWHNEEEKVKKGGSDGQKKWPNIAAEKRNGEMPHVEKKYVGLWGWLWVSHANLLGQNTSSGCLCLSTSPQLSMMCVEKNCMHVKGCMPERAVCMEASLLMKSTLIINDDARTEQERNAYQERGKHGKAKRQRCRMIKNDDKWKRTGERM